MDFNIPGLPHSTVKQLQSASVRELIQKIENHPNRHALQRDLRQSQSFNPFTPESKQMIHEVGNIELCDLLETEPKTQCKVCFIILGHWHCLSTARAGTSCVKEERRIRNLFKYTMDLLSIPDYYTKKRRPHGHRYGKKPGDTEYYITDRLKRSARRDASRVSMTDFIRDEQFRNRMIENGRVKMFVDKWMIMRTKIILTMWHHKNISITKVIGGFVRTRQVPILCQCSAHHEIKMLNIDNELIRERIEAHMDFKIPGLPLSTVKQVQSASVRELIQKIENHSDRHALQRDLRQNQSYNPFSPESKRMIHEVGNIELCELLDMEPTAQCKVCLSYWNIGILYCTCGHFLRKGTEEKFVQYTIDLISIPDYYIKKGRPHGHRYGKKPGDREYYIANSLKKKCKKKFYLGIHDRFVRDEKFSRNMIEIGRTEDLCRQMDDLADENHTHHLTPQEVDNYKSNWWTRSNKIGSDTVPIRHRYDFKQALSTFSAIERKRRRSSTKPTMGTEFFFFHGGIGKVLGGPLILMKVTVETYPVLIDHGNLINK